MKEKIIKSVTDYYLASHDFNGKQIKSLLNDFKLEWTDIRNTLYELVQENQIRLIDEHTDINPNIIRIGFEPIESQLSKLDTDKPKYMCVYPTPLVLKDVVILEDFKTEPYKLKLALGDAQLSYYTFDLVVLEFYRNDPRYRYENNDIQGKIFYDNENMINADKTFLETYGFAYDNDFNRTVAVFTRYLANLTPEHQQIWKAKEINGKYKLHPDYYGSAIIGDWHKGVPICQAILKELYIINQMCEAMGKSILFRESYGEYAERRPKKFHFLIRPTLSEFNDFILLFDKMLSENINKDFFMGDVEYEKETTRNDGKIIVHPKGTLQLLDEWFKRYMKLQDWSDWNKAIKTLKKVRKLRQQPAHSIKEDVFDRKYFKDQREIILDAYQAIKLIRVLFSNHPKVSVAQIEIPKWLYEGKIWKM